MDALAFVIGLSAVLAPLAVAEIAAYRDGGPTLVGMILERI